ncbi:MAG: hypothetical protein N2247_10670 [Leptospiraceae bacterium]|jgi:hypothetical protein|nr:hypothetical protein [Leptospiraceae bacterium]
MKVRFNLILNGFLVVFGFFLVSCNQITKDQHHPFLTMVYYNEKFDSLPWGKSPQELQNLWNDYFISQNNESIEFAIKAEVKDQETIPILKEFESPYIFRFICFYNNNQCVIFKIEKFGTEEMINEYYKNILKKNQLIQNNLKKSSNNQHTTEAGNKILEQYELYETDQYIIQAYISRMEFPEDVKKQKTNGITIENLSDIDLRIYSKKYNPGLNLDFFIKN